MDLMPTDFLDRVRTRSDGDGIIEISGGRRETMNRRVLERASQYWQRRAARIFTRTNSARRKIGNVGIETWHPAEPLSLWSGELHDALR